jgi:SAM-dependent methyltransferase
MLSPIERLESGRWIPPWIRYQHEARYAWAAQQFCRSGVVLDCASASAYGAVALLAGGAGQVVAVDIAVEAFASEGASYRRPRLGMTTADATQLPFADETFDVFISFETIEHVDDDAAYVREARRVVKRGGVFVCSTPNRRMTNPGTTIADHPFNPFHVREYTAGELGRAVAREFDRVEWFGQTFFAPAYARAINAIGDRVRGAAVRLHQLRKVAGAAFDRRRRHQPVPLTGSAEPEVLIVVCR